MNQELFLLNPTSCSTNILHGSFGRPVNAEAVENYSTHCDVKRFLSSLNVDIAI